MEVSTVPPSLISPTKGDDPCEIDVTSVATHTVTLLIGLCGLAGNGAVLRLISLKESNHGIFYLAVIDFLFLLFAAPSTLLFLVEDVSCSPVMPLVYVSFLFQLSVISYYLVLFLMVDTMDSIEKLFRLCCRWQPPLRLLLVVEGVQFWAFFAVFTVIPTVTFLCPSHDQEEQCRAALTSTFTVTLLLFVAPVVIIHTIDFIKAKFGSQQQQPERRDTVILLIVLLTLFLSLWNFLQQFGYIVVSSQVFLLLACINSSIKPFIYFFLGRCWSPCSMGSLRLSLQRVFEEQKDTTSRSNDAARDTVI